MNKYKLIVILVIVAILLMSCGSKPESALPEAWADRGEIRVYEVFGMDCPGCHGGLEKQLNALEGVADSKADWTSQQVMVLIDSGVEVSDANIHEGMKRANFTPGKRLK
ncbi:MAG: heavy-metal-associated domain-containing protein [FCB group bacterium]|nr:heavy-metal-associated domain-containing protein [FCB group bacterium]MBL7121148.1 heavy-metal-associated domain-containing protein [Candidatus Neomarinimicrobiota bacterium]